MKRGTQIVLTAPFTEMIDHAGYFIQMGMASIPIWMEWIMDKKYPEWRNVKRFEDGSAHAAPAGLRVLERVMAAEFGRDNVVVCYPDDLDPFIGPDTRIVALSTHNPLGVTFAAGVYTSIFGSSREPINSHYAAKLFDAIKANPHRESFRVLLGGSGSWQITQTKSMEQRGLFGFLVPSVFTPLEGTRMEHGKGVTETRNLSRLQWQLILRCWKLYAAGKLYKGRPIKVKTRAELLASTKPNYWKYLREDAGDIPAAPPPPAPSEAVPQLEAV